MCRQQHWRDDPCIICHNYHHPEDKGGGDVCELQLKTVLRCGIGLFTAGAESSSGNICQRLGHGGESNRMSINLNDHAVPIAERLMGGQDQVGAYIFNILYSVLDIVSSSSLITYQPPLLSTLFHHHPSHLPTRPFYTHTHTEVPSQSHSKPNLC